MMDDSIEIYIFLVENENNERKSGDSYSNFPS